MPAGGSPVDEQLSAPTPDSDRLRVQCPEGDFAVESHDEDELVRFVREHARCEHDLDIDRDELHDVVEDERSAGIE